MTFYQQNEIIVELFYDNEWNNITNDVRGQPSEGFGASIDRGSSNESDTADPSRTSLYLNNLDGRYTIDNPNSPLFGKIQLNTPIRITVNNSIRVVNEVSEWPVDWDRYGKDVWAPIQASGILSRLNQDREVVSAMFGTITGSNMVPVLVAYWSLEDEQGASVAASGIPGQPSMRPSSTNFPDFGGRNDVPVGTKALPDFSIATASERQLVGQVPNMDQVLGAGGSWTVSFLVSYQDTADYRPIILQLLNAPGNIERLVLEFQNTQLGLTAIDGESSSFSVGTIAQTLNDGAWYWVQFESYENGANIEYDLTVYNELGQLVFTDNFGSLAGSSVGSITQVMTRARPDSQPVSIGHISVWATSAATVTGLTMVQAAVDGFYNERAGRRIERLCAENQIPFTSANDLDDTQFLGVQEPGQFLSVLHDAEEADQGILFETRNQLGLSYRTGRSFYNQDPDLAISYNACQLRHPLRATRDTRFVKNDIIISRTGGSSFQLRKETGPLSVQPPPVGIGHYDDSVSVNVAHDLQLPNQAAWRLLLGTLSEARFPVVRLRNLAPLNCPSDPLFLSAASTLEVGSKIVILDPPPWLPPNAIEQIIRGYGEEYDLYKWLMQNNTTPASPYTIGLRADTQTPLTSVNQLTNDDSSSNPGTTASVSPNNNSLLLLAVVVVTPDGPAPDPGDVSVDGLGLTWVLVASQDYRLRRRLYLFRAQGGAATGTLTITYDGTPSFQEMQWSLSEWTGTIVGNNGANAVKGINTSTLNAGGEQLAVNIGSTVNEGDTTYVAFGVEEAGGPPTLKVGWNQLSSLESSNVRHLVCARDPDQDQTPSISWTDAANGAAAIGLIVTAVTAAAVPAPASPTRRDTAGSVLDAAFDAGTDTSFDVETTLGPLWGQTGASNISLPFDVNISGARVRVTAIGAPTGQVQTFTCQQAILNNVNKTIAAGVDVRLWQPAVRGL
jgi:hypothetical protein